MSFVQLYSLRRILKLQVDNTFSRPLFLFSWTSLFQLLSVWKHHSEWWHGKDEERKVGAYFEVELIMPISGGPKEKQRSTNCSTMRFDTSIPPVILTSEVRKEIWLYLRFVLPVPSLRITKYQEWPARYQKKKKKATSPYTHCLFAWHNRSIPTWRRQIANRWMQLQLATSHQTIWHLQWLPPTPKGSDLQVSWIESRK